MKGIFFTELIDLVEETFGYEVADQMIEGSALPSGGAYTAIGNYDLQDLVQLIAQLQMITGRDVAVLMQMFGQHLFGRLVGRYPEIFEDAQDCFSFLAHLDRQLLGTMNRLYPEAELPQFTFTQGSGGEIVLAYHSANCLEDLAEGLIRGCVAHFREPLQVRREIQVEAAGTVVRFYLAHPAHSSRGAD